MTQRECDQEKLCEKYGGTAMKVAGFLLSGYLSRAEERLLEGLVTPVILESAKWRLEHEGEV